MNTLTNTVPKEGRLNLAPYAYVLLFLLAAALVSHNFSFHKFRHDGAKSIKLGEEVRAKNFMTLTGGYSAASKIHNGPFFGYYMGVATWLTHDPHRLALSLALFNLAGVALLLWLFYRHADPVFGLLSGFALAVNPSLAVHANLITNFSFMTPFLGLYYLGLVRFYSTGRPGGFVAAVVAAAVMGQIYLAGYFLFIPLAIIFFSNLRPIGVGGAALAAFSFLIIAGPFFYFLLAKGGEEQVGRYMNKVSHYRADSPAIVDKSSGRATKRPWLEKNGRLLQKDVAASSSLSFSNHFSIAHYKEATRRAFKVAWPVLYPLSFLIAIAFVIGLGAYLVGAIMNKSPIATTPEAVAKAPLLFQIAGLTHITVVAAFMALGLKTWPHYFQALLPTYALLAAWPFWRLWRYGLVKGFAMVTGGAHLVATLLLFGVLRDGGGGFSYGLTYERQAEIIDEIDQLVGEGATPALFFQGRINNEQASYSLLKNYRRQVTKSADTPLFLSLVWDEDSWSYSYHLRPLAAELLAREKKLEDLFLRIPDDGEIVAVRAPFWVRKRYAAWPEGVAREYPADTAAAVATRVLGHRAVIYRSNVAPASAGYVLVDLGDPRMAARGIMKVVEREAERLFNDFGYGLIDQIEGAYLFRQGAPKQSDYLHYGPALYSFNAGQMAHATGRRLASPEGTIIEAKPGQNGPGILVFGPYVKLPGGEYTAHFTLGSIDDAEGKVGRLLVTGGKGKNVFAEHDLSLQKTNGPGVWQNREVPFNIPDEGASDIEFVVEYNGAAPLRFYKVTLAWSETAFARKITTADVSDETGGH